MVRVTMSDHSHAPNPDELIQLRARSTVRSAAAASSCERVYNIVAETVETIPVCDHVALNEQGLRRAAYASRKRLRQEHQDQPGNCASLQTLAHRVSSMIAGTICCSPTLDLGRSDSCSWFSTPSHPPSAGRCCVGRWHFPGDTAIVEATVFVARRHPSVQHASAPLLGPGQNQDHVQLRMVVILVPDLGVKNWVFDFEACMIHTHQEAFPHSKASGCFFHLSQALGWRQHHLENSEFRRRVMGLSTLAFLPLAYVEKAFDMLKLQFPQVEHQSLSILSTPTLARTDQQAPILMLFHVQQCSPLPTGTCIPDVKWFPTTTNACERFHFHQ